MNKICIRNFGPVQNVSIDLNKDMQVFIGAQASGKSTICKVIYFCKKIRDYTLEFLMDSKQFKSNHPNDYYSNFLKYLTRQFMGCFGKTTHMQKFDILYQYETHKIRIVLNKDGYVRFIFDDELKQRILKLIDDTAEMFLHKLNESELNSIIDSVTATAVMKEQLKSALCVAFHDTAEIVYIPAGRSLLASMSEQLHSFSIADMDLTMQEFVNLIQVTKSKFGSKIPEMVKFYTKTVTGQINNSAVEQAYRFIKNIFKADYTSENDGEKIYFDDNHWVKLMYGSSGQQEVLWILMLSFIFILENRKTFMVIEEPEAHLFPLGQKEIISLITLMANTTASQIIITTHSPYILTSLNILLYSGKIENGSKGHNIVPKDLRIDSRNFNAYKVENSNGQKSDIESLLDNETQLIDTDYIDEVSAVTNSELDQLIEMEVGRDL